MTASERLRELTVYVDEGWDSGPYDLNERRRERAVMDALPLIADVVEALEENHPYDAESGCPQCVALAALRDALEEK